eukprot:7169227-Alexandrium_andersonii.AAC.1
MASEPYSRKQPEAHSGSAGAHRGRPSARVALPGFGYVHELRAFVAEVAKTTRRDFGPEACCDRASE